MGTKQKKEKYAFSNTFKTGGLISLILSSITVLGGFILMILMLSLIIANALEKFDQIEKKETWIIVGLVTGLYLIIMGLLTIVIGVSSFQNKTAKLVRLLIIFSFLSIASIPGGIILLWAPSSDEYNSKKKKEINEDENNEEFEEAAAVELLHKVNEKEKSDEEQLDETFISFFDKK